MLFACTYLLLLAFVVWPLLDESISRGVAPHSAKAGKPVTLNVFVVLVLWLLVLVALPATVDSARQIQSLEESLALGQDDYHFISY